MTLGKQCKCGHVMSDHVAKSLTENGVIIKQWYGYCDWDGCSCRLYDQLK